MENDLQRANTTRVIWGYGIHSSVYRIQRPKKESNV